MPLVTRHLIKCVPASGLQGEILPLERALTLVTFIGKDRPQLTYTHPRVTGTLGPLMQSLGLTGAWLQAK